MLQKSQCEKPLPPLLLTAFQMPDLSRPVRVRGLTRQFITSAANKRLPQVCLTPS